MKLFVVLLAFLLQTCCEAFRIPNTKAPPTTLVGDFGLATENSMTKRTFELCAVPGDNDAEPSQLPKAVVFDLDGCLWTPEMYEILYFMGGRGAPFREDPDSSDGSLLTVGDQPVKLLGDVKSLFRELHSGPQYSSVKIGVSSRTDEPDWARELLEKFLVDEKVCLMDVLDGPIEIAKDGKVEHFSRIRANMGIAYEKMVFFDNEYGNCQQVASLGVSVVYCPNGVTRELWELMQKEFPRSDGSVINSDARGGW
mmetsp:Transcript_9254/g.22994  ORF Transcript_9254/g.22994 Transcript_9254/m.22994 type:complete len:254 (-) Transcript_9254:98-859(-)